MKTIRTFLAIPLLPNLARTAAQWISETKTDGDGIKWVPLDNLHLTLKFLGEVENVETPRVCNALEEACEDLDPFELLFQGASGLPSLDRPRVLTVHIDDPTQSVTQLVGRLEDIYADMGFKREPRDYRPHLTMGRTRSGSRKASDQVLARWMQFRDQEMGNLTVTRIQVVGSFLEKRGPTYNVMDTVEL